MVKFYDLNIPRSNDAVAQKHTLKLAQRLGYEVVAISETLKYGDEMKPAAPPCDLSSEPSVEKLQQLSRITIVLTDSTRTDILRRSDVKSYDILAVQPTSEKTFHMACHDLNIDLITFDLSDTLEFHLKYSNVQNAWKAGKFFEICYAPAIRDATRRKHIFKAAAGLTDRKGGRNLIISSGALRPTELRGPYDVANLATLFGVDENSTKHCVSSYCRALLLKAATRKQTIKSSISVNYMSDIKDEDKWKVRQSLKESERDGGKREAEEKDEGEDRKGSKKLKAR